VVFQVMLLIVPEDEECATQRRIRVW
jgi:hypothetical protein